MQIKDNRLTFQGYTADELLKEYGSPLFVYEEDMIRQRCRELKNLVTSSNFLVKYSCKANNNVSILKIMREEGMHVDAMSPGEIYIEMAAGYTPDEIMLVTNNVSVDEMRYAADRGILMSLDSVSQMETYGQMKRGGEVFVRINPGIGDGHHKKVMTGGKAKFGVMMEKCDEIKAAAEKYDLKIIGLNMHVGSLFMEYEKYIEAVNILLDFSKNFDGLQYIDFGGGFGIPYNKKEEKRFPIEEFSKAFDQLLLDWRTENGIEKEDITFIIEPGRYPVAESGAILGTVHSIKENYGTKYIGTDIGFNVLIRPAMYDSYHEVVICNNVESGDVGEATVSGNICESGDLLCKGRSLPKVNVGDPIAVLDAGAYGYSMSSNYNARLRPAEVLIGSDGSVRVIREREDFEVLLRGQVDKRI